MTEPTAIIGLRLQAIRATQPSWKGERKGLELRFHEATDQALSAHHCEVVTWGSEAHGFPGFGVPTASTIDLRLNSTPRRLGSRGTELNELDLLFQPRHTVVLGDPGAGKTTTLRRLSREVALGVGVAPSDEGPQFVVLVVCREEDWVRQNLFEVLMAKTGMSGKLVAELDDPVGRLIALLNAGALVVIDGLDEISYGQRSSVERDLAQLARRLHNGRVIASCRSGDYNRIEQFNEAEILPLNDQQIGDLSLTLLGDDGGAQFLRQLHAVRGGPSLDLANRPLFLGYMARIFGSTDGAGGLIRVRTPPSP